MSLIDAMRARLRSADDEWATGDRGNSFVEYALVVALIVMVCLAAMTTLGQNTSAHFEDTAAKVEAATLN